MGVQDEVYKRLKTEIETDPQGVGYAGKTDAEIAKLINQPVVKQRVVEEIEAPPISRILEGVESAANIVSQLDVTSAKVFVAQPEVTDGEVAGTV